MPAAARGNGVASTAFAPTSLRATSAARSAGFPRLRDRLGRITFANPAFGLAREGAGFAGALAAADCEARASRER